jgi:hypothetical protein
LERGNVLLTPVSTIDFSEEKHVSHSTASTSFHCWMKKEKAAKQASQFRASGMLGREINTSAPKLPTPISKRHSGGYDKMSGEDERAGVNVLCS